MSFHWERKRQRHFVIPELSAWIGTMEKQMNLMAELGEVGNSGVVTVPPQWVKVEDLPPEKRVWIVSMTVCRGAAYKISAQVLDVHQWGPGERAQCGGTAHLLPELLAVWPRYRQLHPPSLLCAAIQVHTHSRPHNGQVTEDHRTLVLTFLFMKNT